MKQTENNDKEKVIIVTRTSKTDRKRIERKQKLIDFRKGETKKWNRKSIFSHKKVKQTENEDVENWFLQTQEKVKQTGNEVKRNIETDKN